jgi:hypothetical protein
VQTTCAKDVGHRLSEIGNRNPFFGLAGDPLSGVRKPVAVFFHAAAAPAYYTFVFLMSLLLIIASSQQFLIYFFY